MESTVSKKIFETSADADIESREIETEYQLERVEKVINRLETVFGKLDQLEEPGVEKPDQAEKALTIAESVKAELDGELPSEEALSKLLKRIEEAEMHANEADPDLYQTSS